MTDKHDERFPLTLNQQGKWRIEYPKTRRVLETDDEWVAQDVSNALIRAYYNGLDDGLARAMKAIATPGRTGAIDRGNIDAPAPKREQTNPRGMGN